MKRVMDIVLSLLILVLLSPVLLLIALMVRVLIGTPVLFRQQRPGLHGRVFTLLKFRTMTDARDKQGALLPDGERLTILGRFLRSSSLDELPELFNVLKGEMSLVGPRPLLIQYLDRYTPEQGSRHDVLPGITGWAQINGRNAISWEERLALDAWYAKHHSVAIDVKILLLTIPKVLLRQNINHPGEDTMSEFLGTPVGDRTTERHGSA